MVAMAAVAMGKKQWEGGEGEIGNADELLGVSSRKTKEMTIAIFVFSSRHRRIVTANEKKTQERSRSQQKQCVRLRDTVVFSSSNHALKV